MADRNPSIVFPAHFQNWINPVHLGRGTYEPDEVVQVDQMEPLWNFDCWGNQRPGTKAVDDALSQVCDVNGHSEI